MIKIGRGMLLYFKTLEAWVSISLLLISANVFIVAFQLPGGTFDPLGPGAAPEIVSALLCFLCLIVLARGALRTASDATAKTDQAETNSKRKGDESPFVLAGLFLCLVAYLFAFQWQLGHFISITIPFVFAAVLLLDGVSLKNGVIALALSVGLSVGIFYAMTEFFVIRLPGV